MTLRDIERLLRPIRLKLLNMLARGLVETSTDSDGIQSLQVSFFDEEIRTVERFQNYGMSSNPPDGSEVVTLFLGGRRDHGIAFSVDNRQYRIRNLSKGEVAIFNNTGSVMTFKANGNIKLEPSSGVTEVVGDVIADGISLKEHSHSAGGLLTGASPGAPVTGSTGGPE